MTAASDQLLLSQAARGDSQAVDQLLTRYKGLVRQKASVMYWPAPTQRMSSRRHDRPLQAIGL